MSLAFGLAAGVNAFNQRRDIEEEKRLRRNADARAQGIHDETMSAYEWERQGRNAHRRAGIIMAGEDEAPQAEMPAQGTPAMNHQVTDYANRPPVQPAAPQAIPTAEVASTRLAGEEPAAQPAPSTPPYVPGQAEAGGLPTSTDTTTASTQSVAQEGEPAGALPSKKSRRARAAAKEFYKAGRLAEGEAMESKAAQFDIEADVAEVGKFVMGGGTEEQFVEKFLKGASDSPKNPFKAYVVKDAEGKPMIATIDPQSGEHRVRSMREMVNEYIGVIHMTKGNPEKWLNAKKEERDAIKEEFDAQLKNGELIVKDNTQKETARHHKAIEGIYGDRNAANIEIAELRAQAQRANKELAGATEDGKGLLLVDKATGAVTVAPLPEGVDGRSLFPRITGRNMMDEATQKALYEAIDRIPPNAADYDRQVRNVYKGFGLSYPDPVLERLGGKGGDPYATPEKPSPRSSSGKIDYSTAPKPAPMPTGAEGERLELLSQELSKEQSAAMPNQQNIAALEREIARVRSAAPIKIDSAADLQHRLTQHRTSALPR